MTTRPSRHRWDHDAAFHWWFNSGAQRRTFAEVGAHFGVHHDTVRSTARDEGWQSRALRCSEAIKAQSDAHMIQTAAERRIETLQITSAVKQRFARRLEAIDGDTEYVPSFRDVVEAVKVEQMLHGGTPGTPGRQEILDGIDAELARMTAEDVEHELRFFDRIREPNKNLVRDPRSGHAQLDRPT
jgi:hypothetical protein